MEAQQGRFRLDRRNRKLLGVCAGIADHSGVDVTLVRVGMVLAGFMTFPVVAIGYFVVALVADTGGRDEPAPADRRRDETGERMRDIDARLQAIEGELTSSGSRLSREIDSLR